jgi:hypothetical protein
MTTITDPIESSRISAFRIELRTSRPSFCWTVDAFDCSCGTLPVRDASPPSYDPTLAALRAFCLCTTSPTNGRLPASVDGCAKSNRCDPFSAFFAHSNRTDPLIVLTNRFDSAFRIQYAPGVPKILLGNRLHLAFKRQVNVQSAENYAQKHNMSFFEVSPLCNYNIRESFAELSRIALQRNGMDKLWRQNTGK